MEVIVLNYGEVIFDLGQFRPKSEVRGWRVLA